MSATTPTTSCHTGSTRPLGPDSQQAKRLPIGFSPGHMVRASVSFTIVTIVMSRESCDVKSRPALNGMCTVDR